MFCICCALKSARNLWAPNLWVPSIFQVDATWIALTTLYAVALCAVGWRLYGAARRPAIDGTGLRFWAVALGVMAFLFANRLFNLQFILTLAGRFAATGEGCYESRRPVQALAIAFVSVGGLATVAFALSQIRESDWRLVVLGIAGLVAFIAARAVSFHWAEAVLGQRVAGLTLNGLAEAAAIAPVIWGAAAPIIGKAGGDATRRY